MRKYIYCHKGWKAPKHSSQKRLANQLKRVGLQYHSPHKFRHGHAVYALKNAKAVSTWRAVSQNLIHKNLSITDGVYGILSDLDVKQQIIQLGQFIASKSQNSMN